MTKEERTRNDAGLRLSGHADEAQGRKTKILDGLLGSVEAGGTKFLCAVSDADGELLREARIPTTTPDETLGGACDFFRSAASGLGRIAGMGIASFGPIDLNPRSPSYGHILSTTKPYWTNVDIVTPFRDAVDAPIILDTDVNGAALGEAHSGAAQAASSFCYITVGTGIGGGLYSDGKLIRGANHPEIGHMRVPRHPKDTTFSGVCPYHGDCLEGLASGPAMAARWAHAPEKLSDDHPAWEIEAHYIAAACVNLAYTLAPELILVGGGVAERSSLILLIRQSFEAMVGEYTTSFRTDPNAGELISAPTARPTPGLAGGFVMAANAASKEKGSKSKKSYADYRV